MGYTCERTRIISDNDWKAWGECQNQSIVGRVIRVDAHSNTTKDDREEDHNLKLLRLGEHSTCFDDSFQGGEVSYPIVVHFDVSVELTRQG